MRRVFAVLTVFACMLLPAVAHASGRSVIRDCTDNGKIDSWHSQQDYKSALGHLPSDVDEYTDCRSIIQSAKRRDANRPQPGTTGTGGGGGSSGGVGGVGVGGGTGGFPTSPPITGFDATTPPPVSNAPQSPAEANALNQAAQSGQPVTVAGEPITPGGSGIAEAAFRHSVPGPLLLVVILFGLGALAATMSGARGRGVRAPSGVVRVFDRVFPRRA